MSPIVMLANSNGHGHQVNGLPWWVRAITMVGVPSAIAIFLTYVGAREIPQVKTKVELSYQATVRVQEELREIRELLGAHYRLQQRVCSNTARTESDRQRCFDK